MTTETIQGNKLIAQFMGILPDVYNPERYVSSTWPDTIFATPSEMRYHSSWDWLMPVVEKIEAEGFKFQLCRKRATLLNDLTGTTIMYVKAADKLSSAWELAVYAIRHINHLKEGHISPHSNSPHSK
jgi:hypothetical protein